jgi:CBS domain-containing protein
MRARDIMTSPVITVRRGTSVRDAAALLAQRGFTALPVVDDDDRLIGIVTETDLLRDRFRPGHPTAPKLVEEVMSCPVTAMDQGTDVADLTTALLDAGQRSMPIVDGSRVIGIVTHRDLVRVVGRDDGTIAAAVSRKLEIYGGPDRWTVDARDGMVTITDRYDDETDHQVAVALAEAVAGVVGARVDTTRR